MKLFEMLSSVIIKKSPAPKVEIPDIETLISDRKAFDAFVYTPVREAIIELERRWNDKKIKTPKFVPPLLKDGFRAIQYVCVITPNYQISRYIGIADALQLEPLIFEQTQDKFTSNNEWKHSLGKLRFFMGMSKSGQSRVEHLNVIDFNKANGQTIADVKTFWNQSLVDFHHELFFKAFPHLTAEKHIFEASEWLKRQGGTPREYYKSLLSLLIKHAIQFENFMLDEKELWFTKEIFLPTFIEIYKKTGLKPLIVALEPTNIEGDQFWISYPYQEKEGIINRIPKP